MATSSLPEDEPAKPPTPPPSTATEAAKTNGNSVHYPPFEEEAEEEATEATVFQRFSSQVDALVSKADELERRLKEVAEFCVNNKQSSSISKGIRKEAFCSKRMQEVMRQFGTILKQLSQHKWAWPFIEPVDVEGLGLHDYHEIIKKPMDFTTIRKQMDANEYKNAREIYADVRLVFSNAMAYNEDIKSDVHVMAKTLLEKFEEKWLQLLPKVTEAETRQKEEEAQALANMQVAQEASIAKLARDTSNELNLLNVHVEELRQSVIQRCRKITTEEKRKLSAGISALPPEYLCKALDIISQGNSNFEGATEEVDIDIDAQGKHVKSYGKQDKNVDELSANGIKSLIKTDEPSDITLWRLKHFVKGALEVQAKNSESRIDAKNSESRIEAKNSESIKNEISKRKKVIYDALAKTARKRNK